MPERGMAARCVNVATKRVNDTVITMTSAPVTPEVVWPAR